MAQMLKRARVTAKIEIDMAQVMQRVSLSISGADGRKVNAGLFEIIRGLFQTAQLVIILAKIIKCHSIQRGLVLAHQFKAAQQMLKGDLRSLQFVISDGKVHGGLCFTDSVS